MFQLSVGDVIPTGAVLRHQAVRETLSMPWFILWLHITCGVDSHMKRKNKPTNLHQPESYRKSYLAIKMYYAIPEVLKCINLQGMQELLGGIGQGRRSPSAKHNQKL